MSAPLESTLLDILGVIEPQREDWLVRQSIIQELQDVVRTVPSLRGATVEPFGSFVSNLFTPWADLDVTVMLDYDSYISFAGKKRKLALLGDVLRALRERAGWWRLRFVPNAKVPILKFETGRPAISGDISIDNLGGQMKSKCLFWLNQIDERFRPLVLLVKEWAKTQNINDPKCGTINSYSLSLLVVFHFQTCEPAIFPPLHAIYPMNVVEDLTGVRDTAEKSISDLFHLNIRNFIADRSRPMNRSTLSALFVSFIAKFSTIGRKARDFGICPFTGQWEEINNNTRWFPRTFALYVEDPFQQPENSARTVNAKTLHRIQEVFQRTQLTILSPNPSWIDLHPLLVKPELSRLILFRKQNHNGGGQMMHLHQHHHHHQLQQQQEARMMHVRPPAPVMAAQVQSWRPENQPRNGGHHHVHTPAPVMAARVQSWRPENQPRNGGHHHHVHGLSSKSKREFGSNSAVWEESNASKWRRQGMQQQVGDVSSSKQQLWRPRSQLS